jgi:hypothetical protein
VTNAQGWLNLTVLVIKKVMTAPKTLFGFVEIADEKRIHATEQNG